MSLTWRDAVASAALILIIVAYVGYLGGTSNWLLSTTWSTSAVILVLAVMATALLGTAGDARPISRPVLARAYRALVAVIGVIALLGGVAGLIIGSKYGLQTLVVITIALWGEATVRHALTLPSGH